MLLVETFIAFVAINKIANTTRIHAYTHADEQMFGSLKPRFSCVMQRHPFTQRFELRGANNLNASPASPASPGPRPAFVRSRLASWPAPRGTPAPCRACHWHPSYVATRQQQAAGSRQRATCCARLGQTQRGVFRRGPYSTRTLPASSMLLAALKSLFRISCAKSAARITHGPRTDARTAEQ